MVLLEMTSEGMKKETQVYEGTVNIRKRSYYYEENFLHFITVWYFFNQQN